MRFAVLLAQQHVDHSVVAFAVSSKNKDFEDNWSILLIVGVAGGVVGALMLCLLAMLIWRRQTRRTRAENVLDRIPIRIINPSKKNSLNRRNEVGAVMRFEKQKMLERGDEEDDEMGLLFAKCNLNNSRGRELRHDLFKGEPAGFLF